MTPPNRIIINSDGNELEFVEKKKDMLYYRYTKSDCKLGFLLPLPVEQLERMIRLEIYKEI